MNHTPIKHLVKTSLISMLFLSSLGFTQLAKAQDESGDDSGGACCNNVVQAVNQVESAVTSGFEETIKTVNELFESVLDFSKAISASTTLKTSAGWAEEDAAKKANENATAALTLDRDQIRSTIQSAAVKVPFAGDKDAAQKIGNLSFSSIASKNTLSEEQIEQANQYLQFVSGQTDPLQPLDANTVKQGQLKPPVQLYQNAMGAYTATQSVALNALYKMVADRTPQSGLGDPMGKDKASPLELQEHMVNAALDPQWMQDMVTANPGDVQRQHLFILAGIQQLLFENRMQLEQLNATMAALLLQTQTGLTKPGVGDLRSQAAKQ